MAFAASQCNDGLATVSSSDAHALLLEAAVDVDERVEVFLVGRDKIDALRNERVNLFDAASVLPRFRSDRKALAVAESPAAAGDRTYMANDWT